MIIILVMLIRKCGDKMKLRRILLVITLALFVNISAKAAVGTWIGDYCERCGEYGLAGKCDSVSQTNVGIFRVSFYLNGEKLGSSVNVSSNTTYQQNAMNAKWHWGDGKTDIVSYASGTGLGNPTSGGLSSIVISGISTSNVQTVLSPKKNSANVQAVLNQAGITEFKFKDGKIYYVPPKGECEGDYEIQMIVESMQIINWLCNSTGTSAHTWIGTPYELNNGLLAQGYNSHTGGNGYMSGSIVDKDLLSSLRIDKNVKVGNVSFSAVTDCLTTHIHGYAATQGYGFNVYNLTGDFEIECEEECCVPCNPETTDCSKIEGYDPEDPNCCYENGSISEDGTMEACVPPDQYWDNRDEQHNWDLVCSKCCIPTEENDWCCDPSNTLIFENGACEPWGEYWNDKKERYKRYCIQEECPPITLTGDSYCKLADCDEPDNVSIFSDPLLKNLVSDDGSVDVDEITNQLEENIEKYIANQNDTFLAVAYQGETYREAIDYNGRDNEFCDLYCQEVAIVKFPDVYPAANAGRYFQWSISDEETGTLVTQEIVKVCAEDIKYDDFMKKYIKFDEETINKVSFVANYHVGTYCGPLRVFYYGGITCSTAGEIRYAECMNSCQAILNSNACDNLKGSAAESCQKALEEQYQQCIQICPAAKAKEIERCKKTEISYSELKAKWESGYPETYKEKYNEFLSCFSDDINNEIITDLDLKLHYGDNVYDSSNYEKVEGDVISNFTDFHCKQSDECNTGTYYTADTLFNTTNFCSNENFMPREAYDSITDSQKELDEMIKIGTGINNNANYDSMKVPIKFSISFPCDSDLQHDWETHGSHSSDPRMDFCLNNFLYGDYSSNYTINYNFDSVSFSELAGKTLYDLNGGYDEKGFIPNKLMDMNALDFYVCSLVGKYSDSITSCKEYYNLFYGDYFSDYAYPVEAKDNTSNKNFCFRVSDIYTHTNGDDSRSNASFGNFPLSVSGYDVKKNIWLSLDYTNDSNINKDNINYQNTLRFIILQKKDNYILADFVNACTCSDGIVMDAKESDDGSLYCPCKPETFESNYDNSSSDVDADLIIKDTYGICKYSAYDTIDIGGTYTIAYMTGSGTYPLTIDYSNIGSIDNDVAHFSKLSEECGCSGSTCVYDGNMCKISIGNSIMNDNWSYQETNGWSLKASYYICKGGECYDPKCPPGECHVPEPKPKPQPDFECTNGDCVEGLSLIYRSVDLNNPFPGGNNNSDSRTAGENWFGNENRITNNRGLNGTELYSSIDIKPLYYFKFTPSLIKDIRKYNVENGRDYANSSSIAYIDNKLRDDEGNYNVGFSQVLRNDIAGIFVETASANGDSLDKWFRIVTDVDDCSEEETLDTYCYEMSTSWEEYISQGDSSCWDLAKSYLGVK